MSQASRLLVSVLIRLLLLFFAGWFAIADAAMPEGTHWLSRTGLAFLFLIASILVGEVAAVRMHVGLLLGALRAASGGGGAAALGALTGAAAGLGEGVGTDPRESVDILIKALSAPSADTRAKVHAHLQRITGQDLPENADAWRAWWSEAREGFTPPTGGE